MSGWVLVVASRVLWMPEGSRWMGRGGGYQGTATNNINNKPPCSCSCSLAPEGAASHAPRTAEARPVQASLKGSLTSLLYRSNSVTPV